MKISRGIQIAVGVLLLIGVGYWIQQATIARQHEQDLREGKAFFDELCKKDAGEFIYKTVDKVEGIFQMRPRDASKDYFDRMRAGDVPEDPYGYRSADSKDPLPFFLGSKGYRLFEKSKQLSCQNKYIDE